MRIQSDGARLAVYDPQPRGKEAVLLVHGWPLSHRIFEYQVQLLLEMGYRPVSLDLRGFGRSDAPAAGYAYDQLAADLYGVVQALKLDRFILVGFSMGGAVALRYMRLYQGYGVRKLLLLSAAAPCWVRRPGFPYGISRQRVDELIALCRTDRPALCEQFSRELFAAPKSAAALRWIEQIALSASGIATVQTALSLRDEDGRKDLQAVRVPTSILHGGKDRIVPPELACVQQSAIPNARLRMLPDSGHGIFFDQLPLFQQIFAEELRR